MEISEVIAAAGGPTTLARALDIKHPSVLGWRHVPPRHALKVSELTGIPVHELRPDIFPAPDAAASKPGATQDAAA